MREFLVQSSDKGRRDTLVTLLKSFPDSVVYAAATSSAARSYIINNNISLILIDTDRSGDAVADFFQWCKSEYPKTYRVILREERISATYRILLPLAHGSLQVPSNRTELNTFYLRISRDFPEIIEIAEPEEPTEDVPVVIPLPVRIDAILTRCTKEPPTQSELSTIIALDIDLSRLILNRINSPFYGLKNHITSPKQAVVLLGINGTILFLMEMLDAYESIHGSIDNLIEEETEFNNEDPTQDTSESLSIPDSPNSLQPI